MEFALKGDKDEKMVQEIKTINLGGVNCYLVRTDAGYILIDTGFSNKRTRLEKELESAGCKPGNLKLVVITHGDSDHTGNGVYLRERYGARIAMHQDDSGMVIRGDMGWNRKPRPDKMHFIFRVMMNLLPFFANVDEFDTFQPDLTIDEDFDLSEYGFDAKILHLPGHSNGSIGIFTPEGDLYCGDLLYNFIGKPGCLYINDLADFNSSIEKLKSLKINTVYPGHGKPFPMEWFIKNYRLP